jgi:hypothetical protein
MSREEDVKRGKGRLPDLDATEVTSCRDAVRAMDVPLRPC